MVKPERFEVIFYEEKEVYAPGDEVTGHVDIAVEKEMEMKDIKIKFTGEAHVSWSEEVGDEESNYCRTQTILKQKITAHGQESPEKPNKTYLPPGGHKFPFEFRLPQNLPSTYQDSIGSVRYYVKVRIEKDFRIDDKIYRDVRVSSGLNLNDDQNMREPVAASESAALCCWCCAGAIVGEVRIDRGGYVPGEWIVANVTVTNHSASNVRQSSIELVQIVSYYADGPSTTAEESLAQEIGPVCDAGSSTDLTNVRIEIPADVPTDSVDCDILKVQYAVTLDVMGQVSEYVHHWLSVLFP